MMINLRNNLSVCISNHQQHSTNLLSNETVVETLYFIFSDVAGISVADSIIRSHRSRHNIYPTFDLNEVTSSYSNIRLVPEAWLTDVCGPYPPPSSYDHDLFKHVVIRYILPLITVIVLFTNIIVCGVLIKQRIQNPVYVILLAIGGTELLNSLLPLPLYIAESVTGQTIWWENLPSAAEKIRLQLQNLTRSWHLPAENIYRTSSNVVASELTSWTTVILPTITYTISVFLTVLLALQRLLYISWPLKAVILRSVKSARLAVLVVFIVGVAIHALIMHSQFITAYPVLISLPQSSLTPTQTNSSFLTELKCLTTVYDQLPSIVKKCNTCGLTCMLVYFWTRIIVIHLIPCCLLCIITARLVVAMREVAKRRARLQLCATHTPVKGKNKNRSSSLLNIRITEKKNELDDTDCMSVLNTPRRQTIVVGTERSWATGKPGKVTTMLVAILIKFLIAHIPETVAIVTYSVYRMHYSHKENSVPIDRDSPDQRAVALNESMTIHESKPPMLSEKFWYRVTTLCNLIVLISNQLNFFIYLRFSTDFRNTFKRVCCRNRGCILRPKKCILYSCVKSQVPKPNLTTPRSTEQRRNPFKHTSDSKPVKIIILSPTCSDMNGSHDQFGTLSKIQKMNSPLTPRKSREAYLTTSEDYNQVDLHNVKGYLDDSFETTASQSLFSIPRYSLADDGDVDSNNVQITSI